MMNNGIAAVVAGNYLLTWERDEYYYETADLLGDEAGVRICTHRQGQSASDLCSFDSSALCEKVARMYDIPVRPSSLPA